MKDYLTREQLRELLRVQVDKTGTQKDFAEKHGISTQFLNDVLKHRKNPSKLIQQALGVREIIYYEVIK